MGGGTSDSDTSAIHFTRCRSYRSSRDLQSQAGSRREPFMSRWHMSHSQVTGKRETSGQPRMYRPVVSSTARVQRMRSTTVQHKRWRSRFPGFIRRAYRATAAVSRCSAASLQLMSAHRWLEHCHWWIGEHMVLYHEKAALRTESLAISCIQDTGNSCKTGCPRWILCSEHEEMKGWRRGGPRPDQVVWGGRTQVVQHH